MEEGILPPNLHYHSPNPDIPALSDGRLKVITEPTNWCGGYAALNSFGFGGANVHVLLHSNKSYSPNLQNNHPADIEPRLVTWCGRTMDGVLRALEEVSINRKGEVELQALMEESACASGASHPFRGFALTNKGSNINVKVSD